MAYRIRQTRKSLTIQITALILLISFSLYFFLQSDFFVLKNIEIKGNKLLSNKDIERLVNLEYETNIFYLDLQKAAQNIGMSPMVKNTSLYRKMPDTVVIKINEREPFLLLPDSEGFLVVDTEFVILKKTMHISDYQLPLITGIELPKDLNIGSKIKGQKLPFCKEVVESIWDKAKVYIDEINFSKKDAVIMYTHEGIEIKFGGSDNIEDKFQLFEKIYSEKLKDYDTSDINYIDLSFEGLPVVKFKE